MKKPTVHPDAFVAFNATVRGNVRIEKGASIFYGAVLRGDRAPITIGPGSFRKSWYAAQACCACGVVHTDCVCPAAGPVPGTSSKASRGPVQITR